MMTNRSPPRPAINGAVSAMATLRERTMADLTTVDGAEGHLDLADMRRRIKAIFIRSVGNLVEWYDFYAYAAFALYFAGDFFPNSDPVVQQLNAALLFAAGF